MGPSLFDARWIWHPEWIEGVENSVGEFVHFRKSVTIKELPTKIRLNPDHRRYEIQPLHQFMLCLHRLGQGR
jgi:hypothetical protein